MRSSVAAVLVSRGSIRGELDCADVLLAALWRVSARDRRVSRRGELGRDVGAPGEAGEAAPGAEWPREGGRSEEVRGKGEVGEAERVETGSGVPGARGAPRGVW